MDESTFFSNSSKLKLNFQTDEKCEIISDNMIITVCIICIKQQIICVNANDTYKFVPNLVTILDYR